VRKKNRAKKSKKKDKKNILRPPKIKGRRKNGKEKIKREKGTTRSREES
jgi:hypothetical protein